jgi:hypothetical protein
MWLRMLPLELDGVNPDDIVEPENPVDGTGDVIGEMDITCKKLYTLYMFNMQAADKLALDARYCKDKDKRKEFIAGSFKSLMMAHTLYQIMFMEIRDQFKCWDMNLDIKAGFKIVSSPIGQQSPFQIF